MDWFDELKEKLFGEPVERTGQLHHGPLKRGDTFLERHRRWLESHDRKALLAHFRELYNKEQRSADTALHLFSSVQATGLQIQRPKGFSPEVLHHLLEEFKERVIGEGYRTHLSDHRISAEGEHRERYYLKPSIPSDHLQPPLPQRFGNVLIENWGNTDGRADHLKVLITVFNDRLYQPPEPGMELIGILLDERHRQ